MRSQRPAKHISSSLNSVLAHFGRPSLDAHAIIENQWPTIVGARLAAWCRPSDLADGQLVVTTGEPAVAEELKLMARELAATLNGLVGDDVVATVRVRVSSEGPSVGAPRDDLPGGAQGR